jgi:hypothetical protein
MGLEEVETFAVMVVAGVNVRVQRTSVDEEGYCDASSRKISSMRTEMSWQPLRPAAAAINFRRPRRLPRWASIASLVRSDTVKPRRCASWRSRASSSSGSFTVVRFMYASIPGLPPVPFIRSRGGTRRWVGPDSRVPGRSGGPVASPGGSQTRRRGPDAMCRATVARLNSVATLAATPSVSSSTGPTDRTLAGVCGSRHRDRPIPPPGRGR